MATIKKRINITLPPDIRRAVAQSAHRDRVPTATKAAEFIRAAVELQEDFVWDSFASEREREGGVFISHKKAWQ